MLSLLKKPTAKLFEFVVPVTAGAASTVRVNPEAGYVVCYATGATEDKAKQETIAKLALHRCVPHAGWRCREVDPKTWATYSKSRWPRTVQTLPNQAEVKSLVQRGGFFFGPADPLNG